ncbi:MAG: PD-(D/E)XK nuclease family protein, partial [Candidatus Coproplasma sp.]
NVAMTEVIIAPYLGAALKSFKKIVADHAERDGKEGKRLVVLCEDRLSLVAERAVCEEVGGTFSTSIYTLSRFMSAEGGRCDDVLTSQGSAMALSRLIEKNRSRLKLFNRLSAAGAAQEVYDTIALLYSSKISPDDLAEAVTGDSLLSRKLSDLELLYREYFEYLKENGATDRNAYLRRLPDLIRNSKKIIGADVVLLGFQAFTSSVADAVKACLQTADNVSGIFIGGREGKYVNEAWTNFEGLAKECSLAVNRTVVPSSLCPAAEQLRKCVFEPESFHYADAVEIPLGQVNVIEAVDDDDECALFAAAILKAVQEDGVRYRDISVMLPDVNSFQPVLERVFEEYGIPYYVDRRYPLSSHAVCEFLLNYLTCAADGCRQNSVISVVSSPLFTFESEDMRGDKDVFINYMLRAVTGTGGVKRAVNPDICANEPCFDEEKIERVRTAFISGLKLLPANRADGERFCDGVRGLLELFGCQVRLAQMAEEAENCGFASIGSMSARAYEEAVAVVNEAQKLTFGEKYAVREFAKILRSGFTAAQISLIPPKQDAVFVGDLSTCANAGSKVLIVGGLTGAVPSASPDTAILTDSELTSMEKVKLAVSPKISQVNLRIKETVALNLCAFTEKLYLVYPVRSGGEELGASEVIDYTKRLFTCNGAPIKVHSAKELSSSADYFTYYVCRPAPAIRRVAQYVADPYCDKPERVSSVYSMLTGEFKDSGKECFPAVKTNKADLSLLYGGDVSPTDLETFYSCPYKSFAQRGLRLNERREGSLRPLDAGNLMHEVLKQVTENSNSFKDKEDCARFARTKAEELLATSLYSVPAEDGAASYAANSLIDEAGVVAQAVYEQIYGSDFRVESVERVCKAAANGVNLSGRIDRVDSCEDMVRVIDYKTGTVRAEADAYYMGLKLQLPIYLSAAAKDRRPVGAYYFPANLDYSDDGNGFTLQGFMDGSEEVVKHSDLSVEEKKQSKYVGAYLNGKKLDRAMSSEDFKYFLQYSDILLEQGGREMLKGEIAPSPVEKACDSCSLKGLCGYDAEVGGVRKKKKANCQTIAEIVRRANGGGNGDGGEEEV